MTSNQPTGGGDVQRGLPSPTAAWSYDYPSYFSGGDLAVSVFAPDLVVLAKEFEGGAIVALDPDSGEVRFQTEGLAALYRDGALFVVNLDAPPGTFGGNHGVVELDPRTGATRRTITLSPPLPKFPPVRFALAGDRMLAIGDGEITAYELAGGTRLWKAKAPAGSHLFSPVVLADRVVLPGTTYAAYALADGALLWKRAAECCTALASPDGAHLYIRASVGVSAEVGPDGKTVRTLPGEVAAVSDHWVAVADEHGLSVLAHDEAAPTLRLDAPDGFGAIALHGDWLFYFDLRDATLWLHDVVTDQRVALHVAHERFVISPDATGTAPAFVGDPPIVTPPNIYVLDWQLRAYRIGRGR